MVRPSLLSKLSPVVTLSRSVKLRAITRLSLLPSLSTRKLASEAVAASANPPSILSVSFSVLAMVVPVLPANFRPSFSVAISVPLTSSRVAGAPSRPGAPLIAVIVPVTPEGPVRPIEPLIPLIATPDTPSLPLIPMKPSVPGAPLTPGPPTLRVSPKAKLTLLSVIVVITLLSLLA